MDLKDFKNEGDTFVPSKPIETDWISLGADYGMSIAVWENSVTLSKQKKVGDKKWETTQKITMSNAIIEKLIARLPRLFDMTRKKKKESE